jgi:fermentation-respiration switch protein FrsA (DUF1100 family)
MGQERLTIPVAGANLAAVLHLPEAGQRFSCVVAAHGLLSSKDSDKYVQIGETFSQAGFALCRFDFRGCGETEGSLAETTVAQRVADLRFVVERMRAHAALSGRVALLGSSLGAYVSLFVASQDFKVKAVAAWATPANLEDFAERPDAVRAQGLGDAFIAELKAGRYLRAPVGARYCLFIHGDQDELVPAEHARRVYEASLNPRQLVIIPGGNHQLTDAAHRRQAIQLSLDWIGRYL